MNEWMNEEINEEKFSASLYFNGIHQGQSYNKIKWSLFSLLDTYVQRIMKGGGEHQSSDFRMTF